MPIFYKQTVFLWINAFLLTGGLLLSPSTAAAVQKPPLILLLSIDTLRADHLHCYGYERTTSPCIDSFAADAVRFAQTLSQSSKTHPSHMSIWTGTTPPVHGVWQAEHCSLPNPILSPALKTLPEILRDGGYETVAVTALPEELGFGRGFNRYRNSYGVFPDQLPALHALIRNNHRKKRPLFLFLHHYICHSPYFYGPQALRCRFLLNPVEKLPYPHRDGEPLPPPEALWKKLNIHNPAHRRHIIDLYDGGIFYADFLFGQTLDFLKNEGIYDDALIIVLSDHGEQFGEHGGAGHGQLYGEELYVPLLIKFPGNRFAQRTVASPVRLMDVGATLLESIGFAGYQFPQARSFLSLVESPPGNYQQPLYSFQLLNGKIAARVQDGDFVYYQLLTCTQNTVEEWLVNVRHDKTEQDNLTSENTAVWEKMRRLQQQTLAEQKQIRRRCIPPESSPAQTPLDEKTIHRMRALGYLQ